MQTPLLTLLLTAVLLTATSSVFAHEDDQVGQTPQPVGRVLGTLVFPTSTASPEAQAAFIHGMLLLHLFEYPFAAAEFQQAQALDPDFAMAYWGEAMTYNHPIWDQQDRDAALAVLERFAPTPEARAGRIGSERERDFFAALETLYSPEASPKEERDRAYERHMAAMAERYPDDPEVRLFHALAIMGTHAGVRDIRDYMESAAISQSVFYANRQHPGAAHYFIHAVDDPVHAPLGLEAARALYRIAPDAGHSLHMTSHIFTALGMWDDVIMANQNAVRVADRMAAERGLPPTTVGHYNFWLLYGLLQAGRAEEARALLDRAYEQVTTAAVDPGDPMNLDPDRSPVGSLVQMWARYRFETGDADADLVDWQFNTGQAFDPNLNVHYAEGLLASDPGTVRSHLTAFRALAANLREQVLALPRQAPSDLLYLDRLAVIDQELQAALARSSGDLEGAIRHAAEASRLEGEMPYSFGPPFVDYPSAQLLGELALQAGDHELAVDAFSEQLKRARHRRQAEEGLASAEIGPAD